MSSGLQIAEDNNLTYIPDSNMVSAQIQPTSGTCGFDAIAVWD